MRHLPEQLEPAINLFARERHQAFSSEALNGKTSHHTTVIHSSLQYFCGHHALRSDVSQKTAGKGVARAGGIVHLFQRQRRSAEGMSTHPERMVATENSRPILAVLDHQRARPF